MFALLSCPRLLRRNLFSCRSPGTFTPWQHGIAAARRTKTIGTWFVSHAEHASRATERDYVSKQMEVCGHRKWGFVIYRCTYGDDVAWERFMEIIYAHAQGQVLRDERTASELLKSLDYKVFDNRALFEGASKDYVRQHFLSWCDSDDARAEQYHVPNAPQPDTYFEMRHLQAPRYTYCVHVDAESLHSVVDEAPQPRGSDLRGAGWVVLVDSLWEMPDPATFDYETNGMDPAVDDPTDENEEPVEGCRLYEVGWMRIRPGSLGLYGYSSLTTPNAYYRLYHRPPSMGSAAMFL